jgi:predicted  nucleic acid-binding Zn-ribbon protein
MIGANEPTGDLKMTSSTEVGAARRRSAFVAIVGSVLLVASARVLAQASPDQQIMDALLKEGTILQEQVSKLQPVGVELDAERKRLEVEEVELTGEAAKVNKSFEEFNAVADQLNAAMKQQREECESGSSKFQSEVEACNDKATALRAEGDRLSVQGKELDRQQADVNKRIVQHNAAGREWNRRTQEHQQRWAPSVQEVQRWIGRLNEFVGSATFSQFALAAGSPQDCSDDLLGALNPMDTLPTLKRALQCLKALKAGTG